MQIYKSHFHRHCCTPNTLGSRVDVVSSTTHGTLNKSKFDKCAILRVAESDTKAIATKKKKTPLKKSLSMQEEAVNNHSLDSLKKEGSNHSNVLSSAEATNTHLVDAKTADVMQVADFLTSNIQLPVFLKEQLTEKMDVAEKACTHNMENPTSASIDVSAEAQRNASPGIQQTTPSCNVHLNGQSVETMENEKPDEVAASVSSQLPEQAGTEQSSGIASQVTSSTFTFVPKYESLKRDNSSQKGGRAEKKAKRNPGSELIKELHMAAKFSDMLHGVHVFRAFKAQGLKFPSQMYNTLLFLLTGGENWEQRMHNSGEEMDASLPTPSEIYDEMMSSGAPCDGVTYTHLSRMAAIQGDADMALHWVKLSVEKNLVVQLRNYIPALMAYCKAGNKEAAYAMDADIKARNIDLTEKEFALLIDVTAKVGTYEEMKTLLLRVSRELNQLADETMTIIRNYFSSTKATEAAFGSNAPLIGVGTGWDVKEVEVSSSGRVKGLTKSLRVVDLEESEWSLFLESIHKLVGSQAAAFAAFIDWMKKHGPWDIMVDAANVAHMRGDGVFEWQSTLDMHTYLKQKYPDKRILMIVHVNRVENESEQKPAVRTFLKELRSQHNFYVTPYGTNDDWFWLYATVAARTRGLLVSNDELRDHIFSLLRPKHFLKWKERHIANYHCSKAGEIELVPPPPYTSCIQLLDNETWMFPSATSEKWLCVEMVSVAKKESVEMALSEDKMEEL